MRKQPTELDTLEAVSDDDNNHIADIIYNTDSKRVGIRVKREYLSLEQWQKIEVLAKKWRDDIER